MIIDEWVVREVIDTLRQANITLLGVTGLDSPQEFAKKCKENETAISRRINNAISLLNSVKEEESNEGQALLYAVEKTAERTKREVIEKAAEWLKEEMHYKDHSSGRGSWGEIEALGSYDSLEEFIEDFKQAMQDEREDI